TVSEKVQPGLAELELTKHVATSRSCGQSEALCPALAPATCGLVSRLSTRAELGHLFPGTKHRFGAITCPFRCPLLDLFNILARPAHAENFDFPILPDPENGRHIG